MRLLIFLFSSACHSFAWNGYDSKNATSTKFYGTDSLNSSCSISIVEGKSVQYEFVYKKGEEVINEIAPLDRFEPFIDDSSMIKRLIYHSKSDLDYIVELSGSDHFYPSSFEVYSKSSNLFKCKVQSEAIRTANKSLVFSQGTYEGIDSTRFAKSHFCSISIEGRDPQFFIFSYYVNGDLITLKVEVSRFVPFAAQNSSELKFDDHANEFSIRYNHDLTFVPTSFQIKTGSQHSSPNCSKLKLVTSK